MSWQPAALVSLALLVSACGPQSPPGVSPPATNVASPNPTNAAVPAPAHPVAPPQRIVPASAGVVDLVAALVPPERIAGLPSQALVFSEASSGPVDAALRARPQFQAYAAEPLLALHPDLVLCDPWQSGDTTERLREAGVTVMVLDQLESLDGVRATLRQLGTALDAEAACRATLADLDARVARLADGAPRRAGWRALAYSNGGGGGWVAGSATTPDEWIGMTGMRNAGAEGGRVGWVRCSFEELLALSPDLIVISDRGEAGEPSVTAQVLRDEPGLANLPAVKHDRILALDAWLYSAIGPHLVTAAEALAPLADAALAPGAAPSGAAATGAPESR